MKKRTKALSIYPGVKRIVAERDSVGGWPCCVYCGKPAPTENPVAFSNAHYISRAQGGLGIEENILTLCPTCHHEYDQTEHREEMRRLFKAYLERKYTNWSENKLTYQKGG